MASERAMKAAFERLYVIDFPGVSTRMDWDGFRGPDLVTIRAGEGARREPMRDQWEAFQEGYACGEQARAASGLERAVVDAAKAWRPLILFTEENYCAENRLADAVDRLLTAESRRAGKEGGDA